MENDKTITMQIREQITTIALEKGYDVNKDGVLTVLAKDILKFEGIEKPTNRTLDDYKESYKAYRKAYVSTIQNLRRIFKEKESFSLFMLERLRIFMEVDIRFVPIKKSK